MKIELRPTMTLTKEEVKAFQIVNAILETVYNNNIMTWDDTAEFLDVICTYSNEFESNEVGNGININYE